LAALVGLQLWSGHPQVAAYCLVAVSLYFLCRATVVFLSQKNLKILIPYLLALVLGIGLGAGQLLPSLELKQLSMRSRPLTYAQSREYPFYYDYLVTYLSPFFYGDPSDLAPDKEFNYLILVWEICLYCGLAAVTFGLLAFPSIFKEKKVSFWVLLFLLSVIQAVTNWLYFIPGFSSFRVPARFGIIATLSLTVLAAYTVEIFFSGRKHFKIIGTVLIFLAVGDLYSFLGSYNQTLPANKFLDPPSSAAFLKNNLGSQRFYALGSYYLANDVYFSQRGWRDEPEKYLGVRAGLVPNTSILWDLRGADVYSGLTLERPSFYLNALEKSFAIDFSKKEVAPSVQSKRLFAFGAIKYLVTPLTLVGDQDFKLVDSAPAVRDWVINIYEYQNSLPRAYFTSQVRVVDSQVGAETELFYKGQETSLTTILEKVPYLMVPDQKPSEDKPAVDIITDENQKVVVKVTAPQPGYLVLSDTYYPGWRAYLEDKTEVRIVRANYNFRAVPLSAGDHTVTFIYRPESLFRGLRISLASLAVILGLLGYWRFSRPWSPHQDLNKSQKASLL
ncbi:MAG: YfhO family protein, partial [bacterium]|nr:YfhO family protein [bacterium]